MQPVFATDYTTILGCIDAIDPMKYGRTRNFVDGDVSYLSPYISRGVISTKQVLDHVMLKGYKIPQIESFVKELCWRDYFQRVGQVKNLNQDIKHPQEPVNNHEISTAILEANTGIEGIDTSISQLYETGYMHNHCRMYTASVVCNIAQSHWLHPARWMYYRLLDGDWASNACSWQWVAGANSSKKYFANQENVNKYTHTRQLTTFLDKAYEQFDAIDCPQHLMDTQTASLQTILPEAAPLQVDQDRPTFVYNYYNLDPLWRAGEEGNRILLLEPDFFNNYPVSERCMDFMLALSKNIPNMQVFVGSFEQLRHQHNLNEIYYKEHPLNIGYKGTEDSRDWMVSQLTGYFPSFFAYWKKIEKLLYQQYRK